MAEPLSEDTIAQIREMNSRGVHYKTIARQLSIHPSTVRLYTTGRKAEADQLEWQPEWPAAGWELRAIEIRERRDERNKLDRHITMA